MEGFADICKNEKISWPIRTSQNSLSRLITGYRDVSEVSMSLSGNYSYPWGEWNVNVEVLPHDVQKIKCPQITALIFTLIESKVIDDDDEERFAFRVVYLPHSDEDCLWEENMAGSCKLDELNPGYWPARRRLPKGVIWWDKD